MFLFISAMFLFISAFIPKRCQSNTHLFAWFDEGCVKIVKIIINEEKIKNKNRKKTIVGRRRILVASFEVFFLLFFYFAMKFNHLQLINKDQTKHHYSI